jgi:Carboxypeptidase regulatory-like domain
MRKKLAMFFLLLSVCGFAQVTKSSIKGIVKSSNGSALANATVEIKHVPTGTKYQATSDAKGNYAANSVKPGGPYTITVNVAGHNPYSEEEIYAPLGSDVEVNITLIESIRKIDDIVIVGKSAKDAFNKGKSGASQQFSTREINAVPITGSRSINGITKYNANAGSGGTFGGQDSRLNNFTIDGSVFNNGFGLGSDSQAGGRTGSTAISLDAIEQLQVNIAPFDIRQSGFVGSGINAVTRSGSNEIEGSVYHSFRSNKKGFLGNAARDVEVISTDFDEKIWGARIGFPIIKDKLFFFGNVETVDNIRPATPWSAAGSPNPGSQISEVSYADLVKVSDLLRNNFGYETGPFENFDAESVSKKFLARIDYNINDNHKASLRYVHHDSDSDELISNSNSLGFGNRRTLFNSMSYKNSGYVIQDNTRSIVLELDSKFSDRWSNNFIAGFDKQIEDRALQGGGIFPTIDIKKGANNYISAGLDPFTPSNLLDYSTLHFTNNVTGNFGKHTLLFGANFERFVSNNNFFPGSNGVYIFDSLADFEAAVAETVTNGLVPSTAALPSRFQYRYSALPGGAEPLQILKSNKIDLYAQDEFKALENLKLTFGLRATAVSFKDTALENPAVTALTFANGERFNTGDMADTQILFEPRVGFNLDLNKNTKTILRGGTGIFTGRPPLVFLSNAIGNNGVLTGFIDVSGPALAAGGYGFTPNVSQFTPATPTLPSTFDLAFTAKDFKFPQVWKTSFAIDQKLPFGLLGTVEGLFNKNINEVFYYNANLADPVGNINNFGDNRPFYSGTDNGARVNNNVSNAIVLDNSSKGYFYSTTFKLEYPYKKGLWGSIAYTHSNARDLLSAGSIASGSWTGARSVNGNNNLDLSNSNNNTPNRIVALLGYKLTYGKNIGGATTFNVGYIGEQGNPFSYTYGGDINGDRVNGNDLLYVPATSADIRFVDITQNVGGVNQVLYTAAQQAEAFEAFIAQDDYLSGKRGQYVDRNAVTLPFLHRIDVSATQDFNIKIKGKKQTFQFRADVLNFTNMLNSDWGVSKRATAAQLLSVREAPSAGNGYVPGVQLAFQTDDFGNRSLIKDTFQNNASVFDVWQVQFTLRYIFGK